MCGLVLRGKVLRYDINSFDIIVPEDQDLDIYVQRIVNNIDSALCIYVTGSRDQYVCFVNGFLLCIKKEGDKERATAGANATIEDLHRVAPLVDRPAEATEIGVGSA